MRECVGCKQCFPSTHTLCRECFIELVPNEGVPQVVNERYTLTKVRHKSVAATLYEAHDAHTKQTVALKILRASSLADPRAVERLLVEAKLAARFRHPLIAELLDFGTLHDASAFLVSELARGVSLRDELKRLGKIPAPQAIQILGVLAEALDAAHVAGLIHRDLKPESIILSPDWMTAADSNDETKKTLSLKIVGFSLARVAMGKEFVPGTTHVMQSRGQLPLRPTYMSPEQFRGIETDLRTDIFSLGVIAYEMLAGQPPINAKKFGEFGARMLAKPPVPLHVINASVNSLLESTVLRAMQKLPDGRQQRAREFRQELAASVKG
ncbi:MAG: serine/threonine protein kinase [Acidobacteria bacterium]|nr:serine/threonine protein kinase [Acidobacteriota bacterium]